MQVGQRRRAAAPPPIGGCASAGRTLSRTPSNAFDCTMSTQAAIEVADLVKRYGDRDVVDRLSFEVRHGETFAFLGPNGAGKSTTIEILEGFRTATSGTARVLEQDPARGNAEWRGRIGVVSQSSADIERYSAREVLRHFASLYRNPRAVDDTIERCGIAPFASQRVGRLSGGQKRHHRQPGGAVPRRADNRVRSQRAPRVLGPHPAAQRRGHDHGAHDALSRRGGAAQRPCRDHRRREARRDRRHRDDRRAEIAHAAGSLAGAGRQVARGDDGRARTARRRARNPPGSP